MGCEGSATVYNMSLMTPKLRELFVMLFNTHNKVNYDHKPEEYKPEEYDVYWNWEKLDEYEKNDDLYVLYYEGGTDYNKKYDDIKLSEERCREVDLAFIEYFKTEFEWADEDIEMCYSGVEDMWCVNKLYDTYFREDELFLWT